MISNRHAQSSPQRWRRAVTIALSFAASLASAPAHAIVHRTIAIDGEFGDWQAVLGSPANTVSDRSFAEGDADIGSDKSFDLARFAATADDEQLYLYFERFAAAATSAVAVAYIDTGHDTRLGSTDWIVMARFDDKAVAWVSLQEYVPAGATDAVTGDGVDEPGNVRWQSVASLGAADTDGLRLELRIDWASLGIGPGEPLYIHPAIADATTIQQPTGPATRLPDEIRDNGDFLDTGWAEPLLVRSRTRSAEPGGYADLPHTLRAMGNLVQVLQLAVSVDGGGRVELWSDVDGDEVADGAAPFAIDVAGDGDFNDPGDLIQAGADADVDGWPDTGGLAPGARFPFIVRIYPPPAVGAGRIEVTVRAWRGDPGSPVVNLDLVVIGLLTVTPDHAVTASASAKIPFSHDVCNHTSTPHTLQLVAGTVNGWPALFSETAEPTLDLTLGAGTCRAVTIDVNAPDDAVTGATELMLVTATSGSAPGLTGSARNTITIVAGVGLTPPRAGITVPGGSAFYAHTLVNGLAKSASFDFLVSSTLAKAVTVWSDPDGDGLPWDGRPLLSSPALAEFGGSFPLVVQVDIPTGVPLDAVDITTLTIVGHDDAAVTTGAMDATTVRRIATLSGPLPGGAATDNFPGCGSVHVIAGGLAAGELYRFLWFDSTSALVRQSPPTDATPAGTVADLRTQVLGELPGRWSLLLQQRDGLAWADVEPGGSHEFDVLDDLVGRGALVSLMQPSAQELPPDGGLLTMTSVLDNASPLPLDGSYIEYIVFQDQDGDGRPSTGEWFLDVAGQSTLWVGPGAFTCRRAGLADIPPGGNLLDVSCRDVGPIAFAATGTWRIHLRWLTGCGALIAERSASIRVDCVAAAVADAGGDRFICAGATTQLGSPPLPNRYYDWSPATSLDDPTSSWPFAEPPTTVTYALEVADPAGCTSVDDVVVLPVAPPVADAGGSREICPGQAVRLGTPGVPGNEYGWQPPAGLDTTTAARPWASPATTTLYTLEVTSMGLGCRASDVIQVTVHPAPSANPGGDILTGMPLGPTVCDPRLTYSWAPTSDLSDPLLCNPVATPAAEQAYCLTVRDSATSCLSSASCVAVRPPCATPPASGPQLRAVRGPGTVELRWAAVGEAVGGYRGYRFASKSNLGRPRQSGDRLFATAASPAAVDFSEPDTGAQALLYYQVFALCEDRVSEGP